MALITCDFFSEALERGSSMVMPPNTRLVEAARARGLDVTADFRPGIHDWGFWDAQIQDVIAWLGSGP